MSLHRLSETARVAGSSLLDWAFPRICSACHQPVDPSRGDFICRECRAGLRVIDWHACPCNPLRPFAAGEDRGPCSLCSTLEGAPDSLRAAFPYVGPAGELVRNLKYRRRESAVDAMAQLAVAALADHWDALRQLPGAVLVPVPMHFTRRLTRGANHADWIARRLSALTGIPWSRWILARVRRTPPQARRASVRERIVNVHAAFRVPDPAQLRGRTPILVDDVMTSGATLTGCARALREAGAGEVHAVAIVRAGEVRLKPAGGPLNQS